LEKRPLLPCIKGYKEIVTLGLSKAIFVTSGENVSERKIHTTETKD
jgi:hypothetical protein